MLSARRQSLHSQTWLCGSLTAIFLNESSLSRINSGAKQSSNFCSGLNCSGIWTSMTSWSCLMGSRCIGSKSQTRSSSRANVAKCSTSSKRATSTASKRCRTRALEASSGLWDAYRVGTTSARLLYSIVMRWERWRFSAVQSMQSYLHWTRPLSTEFWVKLTNTSTGITRKKSGRFRWQVKTFLKVLSPTNYKTRISPLPTLGTCRTRPLSF